MEAYVIWLLLLQLINYYAFGPTYELISPKPRTYKKFEKQTKD